MSDLVAAYLFCAGTGAGGAFLAATGELLLRSDAVSRKLLLRPSAGRKGASRAFVVVYLASLVLLVLGMLCLVFDLGRPDFALKLFFRPTPTLMTFGSYSLALLALGLVGTVAFRMLAPQRGQRGATVSKVYAVLCAAVAILSAGVMTYAGLLLGQVDGVPIYNTPWLAVLFVVSALAGGLAIVMGSLVVTAGSSRAVQRQVQAATARLDAAIIAAEAAVTAVYLCSVALGPAGAAALQPLAWGAQSGLFWGGFAVGGLVIPFVLDLVQLRGDAPRWACGLAAAAILLGALALRFALIQAGGFYPDVTVNWFAAAG